MILKDRKRSRVKVKREERPVGLNQVVMKVGAIKFVQQHPVDPKTVYVPLVDVGEEEDMLAIACGLGKYYTAEQLDEKLVVVVANLKPVDVYGVGSEGLMLCARTDERIEVLSPPKGAVPGDLVVVKSWGPPDADARKITHTQFSKFSVDLWVDSEKQATYNKSPLVVDGKGPVTTETLTDCPIECPIKY